MSLFGINLKIESLAFQEQDKVVAACSTSALWSVLQGTGKIFHHHIPSPVEITNLATEHSPPMPPETRHLPNNGLSITQMAHAIKSLGLMPYFINPENVHLLKNNVYGYLCGHIPMLMTVVLVDFCGAKKPRVRRGTHAVAITGYSTGHKNAIPINRRRGDPDFLSCASRIDKFYVHDDQVGPSVRMEFFDEPFEYRLPDGRTQKTDYSLGTSWKCNGSRTGFVRAIPLALMVPLYHKIRISCCTVMEAVVALNDSIEETRAMVPELLPQGLEWDIRLTTINEFKDKIRDMADLKWEVRREVLLKDMPRFLWWATAFSAGRRVLDLLFDATDIEQGSLLDHAIPSDEDLFDALMTISCEPGLQNTLKSSPEWKILEWFSKRANKLP